MEPLILLGKLGRSLLAMFQILQPVNLSDDLTLTLVRADGERIVERRKIPYKPEAKPSWVAGDEKALARAHQDLAAARALPPTDPARTSLILSAYGKILARTNDAAEAVRHYQAATPIAKGTKHSRSYLLSLNQAHLEGAWLRGDANLYAEQVVERESLGGGDSGKFVDAHQYLNLMELLVAQNNDVEGARAIWPKFKAEVATMSEREQKRHHYDEAVKGTLLLPARRIKP